MFAASPEARYRAAVRRARRARSRYGRGRVTWWQIAAAVAVVVVAVSGVGKKIEHAVTGATATVAAPSQAAAAAVTYARHQIGCPYLWGGTGPCGTGYDCSGLVTMAYASAGITIPRTTFTEWDTLRHVTSPHKGDLVFFAGSDGTTTAPGHVALVLNPAKRTMIEAYSTGFPIRISTYGLPSSAEGDTNPVGFARPVPLAHHTQRVTVTAATSYTAGAWSVALLRDGGWPATRCNRNAVTAWQATEGDWTHGHAWWRNPLNDKLPEPGSGNATPNGVKDYTSWSSGLTATLTTLRGPDYGSIRAALAAGNNAQAVADAVSNSVWGTQPFSASC